MAHVARLNGIDRDARTHGGGYNPDLGIQAYRTVSAACVRAGHRVAGYRKLGLTDAARGEARAMVELIAVRRQLRSAGITA